jgi:hypothetical protein
MSRVITVPGPIAVDLLDDKGDAKKTYSLKDFIEYLISTNPAFNESGAGIRKSVRIEKAIGEDGPTITLTDEDWETLKDTAENPRVRNPNDQSILTVYPFRPAKKLFPLIDAIASAQVG